MYRHLGIAIVICLALSLFTIPSVSAATNNKFGIHLAVTSDEDIQKAAELVNSNGGDYGYVTLVIQENNRDVGYWQGIFDKLRERHLIPIIRIATQPEGNNWRAPNPEDAAGWADFLGKLRWVVKDRYVIIFNEPNHATEWGGNADPVQYGKIAAEFAAALKKSSPDYRLMFAGLDLAAPQSPPNYYEAYQFLSQSLPAFCEGLRTKELSCPDHLDYISSHSYPNPGFVGTPYDTSKSSIRGYTYEIAWFAELLGRTYPVMITETGWNAFRVGQVTAAEYYRTAFQSVWLIDDRVKAVTPFLLNYQGEPFLQFSFLTKDEALPYPNYTTMQSLTKVAGEPQIIDTAEIQITFPTKLVEDSFYDVPIKIKNTGQRIWDPEHTTLTLRQPKDPALDLRADKIALSRTTPGAMWEGMFRFYTGSSIVTDGSIILELQSDGTVIQSTPETVIHIETQPSLTTKVTFFSKGLSTADDIELQVFDADERLVYLQKKHKVTLGRGYIEHVSNIVPGGLYRVVILKPYYLPRQQLITLNSGSNTVVFEQMLPLDFNGDGKLSISDALGLFETTGSDKKGFFDKVKLLLPR